MPVVPHWFLPTSGDAPTIVARRHADRGEAGDTARPPDADHLARADRERHGARLDSLEISPNLWAGIGLVRGGAGTALVGSHVEIADRIAEHHELGTEEFIMSGYPHLEEGYRFGEGVLPELADRGLLAARSDVGGPR